MEGCLFSYCVFSKDQRVSHTVIVENKRLGHALSVVEGQAERQARHEGADQQREDGLPEAAGGVLYFERNERLDPYNDCDPRQDDPGRFQEASPSPAGRHF